MKTFIKLGGGLVAQNCVIPEKIVVKPIAPASTWASACRSVSPWHRRGRTRSVGRSASTAPRATGATAARESTGWWMAGRFGVTRMTLQNSNRSW